MTEDYGAFGIGEIKEPHIDLHGVGFATSPKKKEFRHSKDKRALITGISGQSGSYLAELLLEKGYEVHGIYRRLSSNPFGRIQHIKDNLKLHVGNLTEFLRLDKIIGEVRPDEIYNLAAQSHVKTSFDCEGETQDVNHYGFIKLIDAIKANKIDPRIYQASTSEMFGNVDVDRLDESSPMMPVSPYGEAKLASHERVQKLKKEGMFIVAGILFNHESPRRGDNFFTRKVAITLAEIKNGITDKLNLGNVDAIRDWGYAPEYVKAMWMMLQQDSPEEYVIGTGVGHSCREFLQKACCHVDLRDYEKYIEIDDNKFKRPTDIHRLVANPAKANKQLGWTSEKTLDQLVEIMVDHEMRRLSKTR